ncbi:hypothetical protein O0L34_g8909 [Tuta absoluta]|nr:hypothetical protein O0L34_g8909 [Tuta absoluta]
MSLNPEQSMVDKLIECLTQQASEFELLKSMYPKNDEIVLTDNKILNDIQSFIQQKSEYIPNHLDFTVNLYINTIKLEICIELPSLYPTEEPDIYVRCNHLNRQQETLLNRELSNYIKSNYLGEVCLYTAISWVQDNAEIFINDSSQLVSVQNDEEASIEDKFVRMWIYSHHIYNKKKREEIVKLAKELHLTGFCLPGKPGIICIEGPSRDCQEWWKHIKSMNWQKIVLKSTEKFEEAEKTQNQKFSKFEEIRFHKPSQNDKHQDMGAFSKFMDQLGLSQAFNDFFGLDM